MMNVDFNVDIGRHTDNITIPLASMENTYFNFDIVRKLDTITILRQISLIWEMFPKDDTLFKY
jgi:hypothetical protein